MPSRRLVPRSAGTTPSAAKKTAKKAAKKAAATKTAAAGKKAAAAKTKTAAKKAVAAKTATKTAAAGKKAAKKAAKTTAVRASGRAAKYPFPFFGAGLAHYFEWGSLFVWFEEAPPRAARAALTRKIPEPFRHDAQWGGPVLHAGSGDQFINLHICMAYARLGDPEEGDGDDDLDDLECGVGAPFPNAKQSRAFEADLKTWLLALHRKHPIAFVARREDGEAGGTRLDAWHRWSLTRFAEVVVPRWEAHLRKSQHRFAGWALREAIGLALDSGAPERVSAAMRRWYEKDG